MSMKSIETVDRRKSDRVVRSVTRNRGKYAFLIGAGTSKSADIPLASEFIERWQNKLYIEDMLGLEIECEEPDWKHYEDEFDDDDPDFHEWVNDYRKEKMKQNQNEYGFWFSECYPTREERRRHISENVADSDTTFGHIMMAGMLTADPPYISHVLTPNFDDLLYDAFYEYFHERPRMLNHNAIIGPEFKLTESDPAIIKLHGDYLYSNLQNTAFETSTLEKNMRIALRRTLQEYGLVVVGYGGRDDSIMDVLTSDDFAIPEPGIIWCAYDASELNQNVEKLLRKPNTYLVEIGGFQDLMGDFYRKVRYDEGFLFPRAKEIEDRMRKLSNKVIAEVESFRVDSSDRIDGQVDKEDDEQALQGLRYRLSGDYWYEAEKNEYAEERYERAIRADKEDPMNYVALAEYYSNRDKKIFDEWALAEDLYMAAIGGPCQETTPTGELGVLDIDGEEIDLNDLDLDGLDNSEIYNGRGTVRRRIARTLAELHSELRTEINQTVPDGGEQGDKSAEEDSESESKSGPNEQQDSRISLAKTLNQRKQQRLSEKTDRLEKRLRAAAEKKWEQALRDFKWAIDRDSSAYEPYSGKGVVSFEKGQLYETLDESAKAAEQYDTARQCHEQAIEQSKGEETPHLNLAEVAFRLMDFETMTDEAKTAADLSRRLSWKLFAMYFQLLGTEAQLQSSEESSDEKDQLRQDIDELSDKIEDLIEKGNTITWVKPHITNIIDGVQDETPVKESVEDEYLAVIPGEDDDGELVDGLVNCITDYLAKADEKFEVKIREGYLMMDRSTGDYTDIIDGEKSAIIHEGQVCGHKLGDSLEGFLSAVNSDIEVLEDGQGLALTSRDMEESDETDGTDIGTTHAHLLLFSKTSGMNSDIQEVAIRNGYYVVKTQSGEEHDDIEDINFNKAAGIEFDRKYTDYVDQLFEEGSHRPTRKDNRSIYKYIERDDVNTDILDDLIERVVI
ncbi:SIR2 family protein [Halosimplex carlsbadense]|nr:SIR2 family protein [Halosimplex carlsbadense]